MQLGQFAASGSSASGMTSVLVSTYQEAGLTRGLFRGMTINYLRAIPMTALSFSVYETMKQLMGMETGLHPGVTRKAVKCWGSCGSSKGASQLMS